MRTTFLVVCGVLALSSVTYGQGWTRVGANPIVRPGAAGSWDDLVVYLPRVVRLADGSAYRDPQGRYYMVYVASGTPGIRHRDATGLLRSTDLITWEKVGNGPVLPRGNPGDVDAGDASAATVLYDGGRFHLWYDGNSALSGSDLNTLNYATSDDLITWQKFTANPILRAGARGADDDEDVYSALVMKEGSTWRMWYTGHDARGRYGLMHATSPAPQGPWTKASSTFLFYPDRAVFPSDVWREDGVLHLLYFEILDDHITSSRIATSADGLTWIPRGEVFRAGPPGAWDDTDIYWPHQILVNSTWYTFYTGTTARGTVWNIGVATSAERFSFVRGGGGIPGPPLTLQAQVSGRAVSVDWAPPPSGDTAASFVIEAGGTFGSTSRGVFEQPAASLGIRAEGLADGDYFVRVKARNASGLGPASNEVRFRIGTCTAVPDAPHNLSASITPAAGGAHVVLQWQRASTGCAPTRYRIEAGSRRDAADLAVLETADGREALAVFAPSGTYFVRVRALAANAVGLPSPDYQVIVP